MSRKSGIEARRPATAGSMAFPFILGMCVAVAFVSFMYLATNKKNGVTSTSRPVSVDIDFSKKPDNPPPPANDKPILGGTDTAPGELPAVLETENTLLDLPETNLGVRKPKPPQPVPVDTAPDDPPVDDEPEAEPEPPVEQKKVDHVVKVTKWEYYWAVAYGRSFLDVPQSFYAEVVFKSFDNPKWVLGANGWADMRKKVRAITTRGGTIQCYQLWPEDDGNDHSTLVKMLFVCPNGIALKEVILDKERWPTPKMTDSGK